MRKQWTRKFYSILAVLALVFTLFNPAFALAETTSDSGDVIAEKSSDLIKDDNKLSQMKEIVTENHSLLKKEPVLNRELQTMEADKEVSVIVQLSEAPVALAKGTQKVQGKTFSIAQESTIKKKVASQQTKLIKELKTEKIEYTKNFSYDHVLNGMAITIKASDLDKLIQMDGVVSVDPDEEMHALEIIEDDEVTGFMDDSVPYLGVPELWEDGVKGDGVKVAVLDTGIDYEHPDLIDVYAGGHNFVKHDDKYTTVRDEDDPYETTPEERAEGVPELDPSTGSAFYTSHGTHVAGTIAAQGENEYNIKGIAPEVELYAYRVLGAYGSGASSGVIAAIEKAAEENMDVINLSLGGGGNNQTSPDSVAINNATLDGVTAVIATGNSGPGRGTIGTPAAAAYAISVGNSTLSETTYNVDLNVTAGDFSDDYNVPMMGWEYAVAPDEVLAGDFDVIAVSGYGEVSDYDGLDVEGKVALVSRGEIAFVDKIFAAKDAGAVGIIVHNNVEGDGIADVALGQSFDFIPAFDMTTADGNAFRDAIEASAEKVGKITFSDYEKGKVAGDEINATSSQGPSAPTFDIKPDVVAPGTNIMSTVPAYGKVYPDANYEKAYDVKSGTSMATPHVAGIAALLLSKNPEWTPFDVKVAMSNTAKQLDVDKYDVFVQGPGRVQPVEAANAEALAYVQDKTTYPGEDGDVTEDYEKGAVTFGRISPDPDEELTVIKEIEVRDLVGKVSDYDVSVKTTKYGTGDFADAAVTVDKSSFTLDGSETLHVTLTVPKGEEELGNEILGYIHLTSDSNTLILPFAAEFSTYAPTGLEYYFLDDEIISPNGDGEFDETRLNFSLYDDQSNVIIELWDPTDPGPSGDNYIGYLDAGTIPAGAWYLPIDGTYVDWLAGPSDIPDGVYTIDFNNYDTLISMAYAPLIVKTAEPEVKFDVDNKITSTEYTVSGTVLDNFINFKQIYEIAFGAAYDVNDYLAVEYELANEDEKVVTSGTIDLNQDGTFEIPLSELKSGAQYSLTVNVEDVVAISAQDSVELKIDEVELSLTPSTTKYTTGPVTVNVNTVNETDLVALKWLPGEKSAEDFADEGNDILDTNSFDVSENGTYTVFAKNSNGLEGVETIEIENITDPIEITLSPSPEDYTVDPVLIDVSTKSPVDLTELKWLPGENGVEDFESAGNDILATSQFEATQNRMYTVYAQNEYGIEAVEMITIDQITDPVELTLTPSTTELTDEPIEVTAEIESIVPLTDLKWLPGDKIAEDIDKNGTDILDGKAFEVTENGAYTVLAKNEQGIYDVQRITINNIQDDINLFFKPSTVDPIEGPLAITVETDSLSDLTEIKWLQGNKKMDDFADGQGNKMDLETKTFEVTENGVYTVYAKNEKGIETINVVSVDNIVYPVTVDLSQTPTEPTYGPVTIHVDANSEVEIKAVRWLPGEKNVLDFADSNGNAIGPDTNAFTVAENGTYTVYAVTSEGYETTTVMEVTNIQPTEEEVTSTPAVENGNATVSDDAIEKLADDGTLYIDLADESNVNVQLSSEQIAVLIKKNASLIVYNNNVEMQIPLNNLPQGKDITLGIQLSDDVDDAVSNVYDLTIHADGEEVNKFETPIQLTFQVDMDKVKDKDSLDVYYFDEEKDEWVIISGAELDDGKVRIGVDHFTKFGVFEMTEEKEDPQVPDPKDPGEPKVPEKDDEDNCDCDGNNGNNNDNNGDNNDGDKKGQNGNVNKHDDSGSNGTNGGDKLPSTATSIYNFMLLGAALLLAGSLALFIYRRKSKKETV